MKSFLPFLLPLFLVTGCASHPRTVAVPMAAPVVNGTVLDPADQENVRTSSVIQTLSVGPSIDAADPNLRHDAHNVERVVQEEAWNLHPNLPTALAMGPVVAVNDPNRQTEPMTPELVQKIQQENQLLQITTEQNEAMARKIAELQEALKSRQTTDRENADLKLHLAQLEKEQSDLQAKLAALAAAHAPAK